MEWFNGMYECNGKYLIASIYRNIYYRKLCNGKYVVVSVICHGKLQMQNGKFVM